MRLAHTNGEFEGNMYLAGSSEKPESLNCVEVYNTMTQTWNPVPPEKRNFKYENFEGKIYKTCDLESVRERVAFKPKDWTWEMVGMDANLDVTSVCIIENVIYSYNGQFQWRIFNNTKEVVLRNLEGLEGPPKFARYKPVKLADCGGKLVVLWGEYVPATGKKEMMIWCAEISLEKRSNEEIWGKVEWLGAVLKVPKSYKIVCAIAATI